MQRRNDRAPDTPDTNREDRRMVCESTLLVRPEHLNHHGYLFGGRLLEWLDEQAYIAAISQLVPRANLVTIGIDNVEFKHPVTQGSLLRFRSSNVHTGRTSLTVHTQVFLLSGSDETLIFRAYVTFVCLDDSGKPVAVAPFFAQPFTRSALPPAEQLHWDAVERNRRERRP
jgi:uncharacterized protein (TIGR00369 family)